MELILEWASLVLVAGTVLAGAGAIVTSRSIKEKQERAIREADARAAEANQKAAALNERAAKLENEAAQAHLEFAKITRPRFEKFNRDAFRNKLKGKPRSIPSRVTVPTRRFGFVHAGDGHQGKPKRRRLDYDWTKGN